MSRGVLQDLEEAIQWYEARSLDAAERFCHAINSALDSIVANPRRYAPWNERYRYLLLQQFPYYIIYRINGDVVTVGAIRHTARGDIPIEEL